MSKWFARSQLSGFAWLRKVRRPDLISDNTRSRRLEPPSTPIYSFNIFRDLLENFLKNKIFSTLNLSGWRWCVVDSILGLAEEEDEVVLAGDVTATLVRCCCSVVIIPMWCTREPSTIDSELKWLRVWHFCWGRAEVEWELRPRWIWIGWDAEEGEYRGSLKWGCWAALPRTRGKWGLENGNFTSRERK